MVKGNGLRAGFFNPCDVHLARSAMAQIPKPALEGLQNRIERGRPWLRWARRVLSLHVVERIPTGAVRRHEIQALVVVPVDVQQQTKEEEDKRSHQAFPRWAARRGKPYLMLISARPWPIVSTGKSLRLPMKCKPRG
eukprot:scaffold392_cov234-Pinguiococcus_pyrenoidosus.AAC.7